MQSGKLFIRPAWLTSICRCQCLIPLAFLLDAASLVTREPAILSREKVLEIKQSAWLCSNGKVKEKLGWKPLIPLKEGIRLTAEWYVEQGWL